MATTNKNNFKTAKVEVVQTASNSGFNVIIWLFIALVGLAVVYGINKKFFEEKVFAYSEQFKEQKDELDEEERKKQRFGADYVYAKAIAAEFLKKGKQNEVLLIPSTAMFTANNIQFGKVPEPAVFYYYTGIKTVKQNCKLNCTAQWYVVAQKGGVGIEKINSKAQQDSIVNSWSAFAPDAY